jgi:hypothetical protein
LLGVRGKEKMEIKIYDLAGRIVEEVCLKTKNQKLTTKIGKNLTPGVYFIKANGYTPVKIAKIKQ